MGQDRPFPAPVVGTHPVPEAPSRSARKSTNTRTRADTVEPPSNRAWHGSQSCGLHTSSSGTSQPAERLSSTANPPDARNAADARKPGERFTVVRLDRSRPISRNGQPGSARRRPKLRQSYASRSSGTCGVLWRSRLPGGHDQPNAGASYRPIDVPDCRPRRPSGHPARTPSYSAWAGISKERTPMLPRMTSTCVSGRSEPLVAHP